LDLAEPNLCRFYGCARIDQRLLPEALEEYRQDLESGSLNNCACKPTDESKRSSALSIEGSSSTTQIIPAAGGEIA
jgi:hypothetical protein